MAANRHRPPQQLLLICLIIIIMALECEVANARLRSPSTPDARLAEFPDIKSGRSLSEPTLSPSPPVNVSRGLVEPFTGFPKGVAYAAGYIFILHESGQMYRCNVSNQDETCYLQNKMYRNNAFNWFEHAEYLDTSFARRMAVEDDEHIITSYYNQIYRCSTMNPYSCGILYNFPFYNEVEKDRTGKDKFQNIAVGGGRIFASFFAGIQNENPSILSYDIATGENRVSSPSSMRQLSVWSTTF
jgi:hypothetical protein